MQKHISITLRQLFVLLVSMMLGVGVLTVPREVTEKVGTPDSWMSVLLALIIAATPILIMGKLIAVFPNRHFTEYLPLILGKFGAWVVGLVYATYYIVLIGFETRMLTMLVRQYLLDKTPMEVLVLPVLFASTYLILGGLTPLVRINQLFLPILLTVFGVILLLAIQNFEPKHIQPILSEGFGPVLKGAPSAGLALLGVEVMVLLGGYIKQPVSAGKIALLSAGLITIINAVTVFLAVGHFGSKSIVTIIYPTLEMVKSIEIPGGFVERLESLFMTIWIMAIFTTITIGHWVGSELLGGLMKRKTHTIAIFLLPITYLITMLPKGLSEVFRLGNMVTNLGATVGFIIPGGLLLLARIRRLGIYEKK